MMEGVVEVPATSEYILQHPVEQVVDVRSLVVPPERVSERIAAAAADALLFSR